MGFNKRFVISILANAQQFEWTLQGLGMFRTYISDEIRLHVWDNRFVTAGATRLHTHPWDFESEIIWGRLTNLVYELCMPISLTSVNMSFTRHRIHCGIDDCLRGQPENVWLRMTNRFTMHHGNIYSQKAEEIHDTQAIDGTVTMMTRKFISADRDTAFIFIPEGQEFTTAIARPAKASEVIAMSQMALQQLRNEMSMGAHA